MLAIAWRWDGAGAVLLGLLFAVYHYLMNRDIRNTLHRIADELRRIRESSEANDGQDS